MATDIGTGTGMATPMAFTDIAGIGAIAIGAAAGVTIQPGAITARTALGVMAVASAGTKVEYQAAQKLTTGTS